MAPRRTRRWQNKQSGERVQGKYNVTERHHSTIGGHSAIHKYDWDSGLRLLRNEDEGVEYQVEDKIQEEHVDHGQLEKRQTRPKLSIPKGRRPNGQRISKNRTRNPQTYNMLGKETPPRHRRIKKPNIDR